MDQNIALAVGALFVVCSAYDRFNIPQSNRSSTTALRYYTSAAVYVCLALISYWVLSRYPDMLRPFVDDEVQHGMSALPPALMTALVLTVLLDKIPFFSATDRWVRQKVQYIANIPHEARILARRLQLSPLNAPPHMRELVRAKLEEAGFLAGDIQFEPSETPQHRLTKASIVLEQFAQWEAVPGFGGFLADFAEELRVLRQHHERLIQKAAKRLRLIENLSAESADVTGGEFARTYRTELREESEELFRNACDLASRGVLRCCMTDAARRAQLRSMGFVEGEPVPTTLPLTLHQLVILFAAVATVLLFGIVVANAHSGKSFQGAVLRVVMVASVWSVAILCALYPKTTRWKMARRGAFGERPAAYYLSAGLAAGVLGMLVSSAFKFVILGFDAAATWTDIALSYPWMLSTFGIAMTTAFQTDNDGTRFGRWQRLVEGSGQACVIALVTYLTFRWLHDTGHPVGQNPRNLFLLLPISAINGFAVGYLVPTWYRASCARELSTEAANLARQQGETAGRPSLRGGLNPDGTPIPSRATEARKDELR